jgi:hypothetical protein
MKFGDKYCAESDKNKAENSGKKAISEDGYAIGELIQALIEQNERARISSIKK